MAGIFNSLPFARGSNRTLQKTTSFSTDVSITADTPKTGSWTLATEAPAPADDEQDPDLCELNTSLQLLTEVFPDVQVEVFREMLLNLSKQSRVEVVTEHLLKDKGKWVKGRYRTAVSEAPMPSARTELGARRIEREETFRTSAYQKAVKAALYAEFKGLSHASIKAILAEHNYSYTASRPVLYQLSTKSWRYYLVNIWSKKRDDSMDPYKHPLINWHGPSGDDGARVPYMKQTGSAVLDNELYHEYIAPLLHQRGEARMRRDEALAQQLNEAEATTHDALFDCECCYSSVTFEEISACESGAHIVCFSCIRHAMNEALFGQGWAKTVSTEKMSLRCLASSADCNESCLPKSLVKRAIRTGDEGKKMWLKFEERIARQDLDASGLPLLQCPFCAYAEVDEAAEISWRAPFDLCEHVVRLSGVDRIALFGWILNIILYNTVLVAYPLLLVFASLLQWIYPHDFEASQRRVLRKRHGLRFKCRSPGCGAASCSICLARWTDPHICHEAKTNSLRHAIEAATTAVVKRTCPRCNTSFVKSSGCNKLVCPCGYAMCYICRSPLGSEGYGHFCQHFREHRGRCRECDRCDLYGVEDEEAIVKKAAKMAEKEWRRKEGIPAGTDINGRRAASGSQDRLANVAEELLRGSSQADWWTRAAVLDMFLQALLA